MTVLVITSCTGSKSVRSHRQLTLADFQRGPAHLQRRETELKELLRPAEDLYTGQQHARLFHGIGRYRTATANQDRDVDVRILSAGYGLVGSRALLAPYEATFNGMRPSERNAWSRALGLTPTLSAALRRRNELCIVLLGENYLRACGTAAFEELGGPVIVFGAASALKRLPRNPLLRAVPIDNNDTKRFSCGMIALKGELGARVLDRLAINARFADELMDCPDVLQLLLTSARNYRDPDDATITP